MGWGYGTNAQERAIGYGVKARCDLWRCWKKIDRGLAYVCGDMHDGGDYGCGGYFCYRHLYFYYAPNGDSVRLCADCIRHLDRSFPEDEEE